MKKRFLILYREIHPHDKSHEKEEQSRDLRNISD
jgi:hypothetical protein